MIGAFLLLSVGVFGVLADSKSATFRFEVETATPLASERDWWLNIADPAPIPAAGLEGAGLAVSQRTRVELVPPNTGLAAWPFATVWFRATGGNVVLASGWAEGNEVWRVVQDSNGALQFVVGSDSIPLGGGRDYRDGDWHLLAIEPDAAGALNVSINAGSRVAAKPAKVAGQVILGSGNASGSELPVAALDQLTVRAGEFDSAGVSNVWTEMLGVAIGGGADELLDLLGRSANLPGFRSQWARAVAESLPPSVATRPDAMSWLAAVREAAGSLTDSSKQRLLSALRPSAADLPLISSATVVSLAKTLDALGAVSEVRTVVADWLVVHGSGDLPSAGTADAAALAYHVSQAPTPVGAQARELLTASLELKADGARAADPAFWWEIVRLISHDWTDARREIWATALVSAFPVDTIDSESSATKVVQCLLRLPDRRAGDFAARWIDRQAAPASPDRLIEFAKAVSQLGPEGVPALAVLAEKLPGLEGYFAQDFARRAGAWAELIRYVAPALSDPAKAAAREAWLAAERSSPGPGWGIAKAGAKVMETTAGRDAAFDYLLAWGSVQGRVEALSPRDLAEYAGMLEARARIPALDILMKSNAPLAALLPRISRVAQGSLGGASDADLATNLSVWTGVAKGARWGMPKADKAEWERRVGGAIEAHGLARLDPKKLWPGVRVTERRGGLARPREAAGRLDARQFGLAGTPGQGVRRLRGSV